MLRPWGRIGIGFYDKANIVKIRNFRVKYWANNNSIVSDKVFNGKWTAGGQIDPTTTTTTGIKNNGGNINLNDVGITLNGGKTIINGGNVGIGTTSPLTKLDLGDIGGNIRLGRDNDSNSNTSDNSIGRSDTNGSWTSRICFFDDGANDDGIFFTRD